MPFTPALAAPSPERFAAGILRGSLRCGAVVVGKGFRFGKGAQGTVAELKRLGARLGFEVLEVAPSQSRGKAVSSTLLRSAVQAAVTSRLRRSRRYRRASKPGRPRRSIPRHCWRI